MAKALDEKGRLFGRVNVVDFLALLVFVAILAGGGALVVSGSGSASSPTTTVVETGAPGYVVDAINASEEPASEDVAAVGDVDVLDAYRTNEMAAGYNRTEYRVRFPVDLATAEREGALHFRGDRLYIGRELELDLGTTIVTGHVVRIGVGDDGGQADQTTRAHWRPAHATTFQYGDSP